MFLLSTTDQKAKLACVLCTNTQGLTVFFGALGSGLCCCRTVSCPADLCPSIIFDLCCQHRMLPVMANDSEGDDQASLSHTFLCGERTE